jgi:hypothetical protein
LVRREEIIRVGRYEVQATRPAKVLFPEDGITKGDLIDYYESNCSLDSALRASPTTGNGALSRWNRQDEDLSEECAALLSCLD